MVAIPGQSRQERQMLNVPVANNRNPGIIQDVDSILLSAKKIVGAFQGMYERRVSIFNYEELVICIDNPDSSFIIYARMPGSYFAIRKSRHQISGFESIKPAHSTNPDVSIGITHQSL